MKTHWMNLCAAGLLALTLGGCGWGQSTEGDEPAGSGDPEADQRAEMRVGSTDNDRDDKKKNGKDGEKRNATLFERLGGQAGIRRLVDDMTTRVVNDPRVNFSRQNVDGGLLKGDIDPWDPNAQNVQHFKDRMVEFISLAAGGPATYQGRDMGTVHDGMKITNSEFDAMIGDIKTSMERLGIARQEQKELIAIFETTRKEIVGEND
ncbi:MAG TPA: group 1 truncated hemoglobin [Phycisphaerales bacterium]|nr:group 1 truncated hemoglobin [Phycisphaerales bacterium]